MNPYITIMVLSYGGPTTYTMEYGRLDDRNFAGAIGLVKLGFSVILLSIFWIIY
jgi:hypothetical protein